MDLVLDAQRLVHVQEEERLTDEEEEDDGEPDAVQHQVGLEEGRKQREYIFLPGSQPSRNILSKKF